MDLVSNELLSELCEVPGTTIVLTSANGALKFREMQTLKVGTIYDVGSTNRPPRLMFKYVKIVVDDIPTEDMTRHFKRFWRVVAEDRASNHRTLVHCQMGISRSVTLVISYLIAVYGMSYDTAIANIRKVRLFVRPNAGFEAQLRNLEKLKRYHTK